MEKVFFVALLVIVMTLTLSMSGYAYANEISASTIIGTSFSAIEVSGFFGFLGLTCVGLLVAYLRK
ncbi:MAG: hypothetical protein ACI9TY_001480 [Alphaproteobacteria bacterium]|jgi:hypothetical protein